MTEEDKKFLKNYEYHTKGFAIHAQTDNDDEGSFSWSPCDTCGNKLGGTRYDCVLTNPGVDKLGRKHKSYKVRSCTDCICYAANGTLPSGYE